MRTKFYYQLINLLLSLLTLLLQFSKVHICQLSIVQADEMKMDTNVC